jgi:RNA polymerase sigma-70 factor (ECF subfamily)
MAHEPSTCVSLLERLRRQPTDQQAWRDFVSRYAPTIHGWCRHWQLQEADAEDVTQSVLLILATRMKTFDYDPSGRFRGWLRTVARHAWNAFVEGRRGAVAAADSGINRLLETLEARDELVRRLEENFDRELLELAMDRIQARVEQHTWEAFRLTAVERLPAADVAARLGMKVATVYVAGSKVRKMIRAEVQRLEGDPPPDAEESP